MDLKDYIRSIPDYPKKGILFRDITTLIKNAEAFKYTNDKILEIIGGRHPVVEHQMKLSETSFQRATGAFGACRERKSPSGDPKSPLNFF